MAIEANTGLSGAGSGAGSSASKSTEFTGSGNFQWAHQPMCCMYSLLVPGRWRVWLMNVRRWRRMHRGAGGGGGKRRHH